MKWSGRTFGQFYSLEPPEVKIELKINAYIHVERMDVHSKRKTRL